MPIPTPFHPRTARHCTSLFWKDWAGCHAVKSFDTSHEREYYVLRHAAGLIDVSPLYKYEVRGRDAGAFLSYVTVKNVEALRPGRVTYLCWCDDDGKVVDDGTVSLLEPGHYRVTAAEPSFAWLSRHARGFEVSLEDSSRSLAALSIQGPRSRAVLQAAGADVASLGFFRVQESVIDGVRVHVSRTGYTGDLGYEVWIPAGDALRVWDALAEAGRPHRAEPVGLDAMDVTRIEAGFLMNGVDYFSANHCLIDSRKSTPFELGLGRAVQLQRGRFVGSEALALEHARGAAWSFVGLETDWDEFERLFAAVGLPARVPAAAWRLAVPVYAPGGRQVGQATSGAWSPVLKQNLALASVETAHAAVGGRLEIEVTVEYRRLRAGVRVRELPFYSPERKRA